MRNLFKISLFGIVILFLVFSISLVVSDIQNQESSVIGNVGGGWTFNIIEDPKEEVDVNVVDLGDGIIELTLFEHESSSTKQGYKWQMALCNYSLGNLKHQYEDSQGGFEYATWMDSGYGILWGMNETWCGGEPGYALFSSGSKNQFPVKIRLDVSELTKFKIYAGTGSVQIEANAESIATAYGANENICQNSTGDLHVAYEVDDSDLWYGSSVDGGSTWATKEIHAGTITIAGITCSPNDDLFITYLEDGDVDMYKSTDSGASWVGPTIVEDSDAFEEVSCASDSNSVTHCCMKDNDDDLWYVNTSDLNDGVEISTDDSDHCDIEVDTDNNVYIVISETTSDDLDIMTSSDSWASRNSVDDNLGSVSTYMYNGVSIAIDTNENIHIASIHGADLQYCNGTTSDLTTWTCSELQISQ